MNEVDDELHIHTHDRITFKRCRRKWHFRSPLREHLEPDPPHSILPLWFGTGIHFALEDFYGYNKFGDPVLALEAYLDCFKPEDLPEGAEEEIALGMRMLDYYMHWRVNRDVYQTVWIDEVPQVEANFRLELAELSELAGKRVVYQGTFDRIVKDPYGRNWIMEYKTARSIDTNKLATDPQVRAYVWAAEQWYDMPFEGVLYLQLVKNAPDAPRILINGDISLNKSQRTTHSLARNAMLERYPDGKFPPKHIEFLNYLAEQETPEGNKFVRLDEVYVNNYTKVQTYEQIIAEGKEMLNPDIAIYPNPTRDCTWDCKEMRTVCVAMDEGSDWEYLIDQYFKPRGDDRQEWKKRIKWPTK